MLEGAYLREDPELAPVQRRWLDMMIACSAANVGRAVMWGPEGFFLMTPDGSYAGPVPDPACWAQR